MTPEQIEAKALAESLAALARADYLLNSARGEILQEEVKAAFIKGCQYAATPSAEKLLTIENIGWEALHDHLVAEFIFPGDRNDLEDWWGKFPKWPEPTEALTGQQLFDLVQLEWLKLKDSKLKPNYLYTDAIWDMKMILQDHRESSRAQPGYSEAIQIVKDIAGIVNTFEVGEIMSRAEQLLEILNLKP